MAEKDIDLDDDCYRLNRKLTEITKKELDELFKSKNYMLDTNGIPQSSKKKQTFRPNKRVTVRELLGKKNQKVDSAEKIHFDQRRTAIDMSEKSNSVKNDKDMMMELFGELSNSMDTMPLPETPANNLDANNVQLPSKLMHTGEIQKNEKKKLENSILSKKATKTPKQIAPVKNSISKKLNGKPHKRKMVDHAEQHLIKNEIPKKRNNLISDLHPELNEKKIKTANVVEAKNKNVCHLIEVADSIVPLERNTMIQSDPNKSLIDSQFADGYLKKIENNANDDTLINFLTIMKNYSVTRDISIPELVEKVRIVFKDNQYLFDGFAPFVLPEQAAACGLLTQHSNYNRVRKFFRCIEINYTKKNKPEVLNRINNVLKKLSTDLSYSVNQLKETVLKILKDERYLCEEFIRLFPEERPPPSRFHQCETVVWDDSLLNKKPNVDKKYEMIVLGANGDFKPGHPSKFDLKAQKKVLQNKKAKIINKPKVYLEPVSNTANKEFQELKGIVPDSNENKKDGNFCITNEVSSAFYPYKLVSKTTSIIEECSQKDQPLKSEICMGETIQKDIKLKELKNKDTIVSNLYWSKLEDQKFLKIIIPIIKLKEKDSSILDEMFKKASFELKRCVSDLKMRFDHWEEKIRKKIKKQEEEEESEESESSDGVSSIDEQ